MAKKVLVFLFLVLIPINAFAWDRIGINFRATAGYVTDGTDETHTINDTGGESYPVTRGGATFGYTAGAAGVDTCRDRDNAVDARFAGVHLATNNGSSVKTFRVDLPSTGDYIIRIAAGDRYNSRNYHKVEILDNTTSKATIVLSGSPATADDSFMDAAGVSRTRANWPSQNVSITHTFATTTFFLKYGSTDSQSGETNIAHLYLEKVGAEPTPTPTPTPPSIETICGSGIGTVAKVGGECPANHAQSFDDADLCYLLCPDDDRDRDGFTSDVDCDDTDPTIYPSIPTTKGCTGGEHRTCQSNGTYTACTSSTLCEATGSGSCYYIDVATGNDANACTFASPCRNLTKFMGTGVGTPVAGAISLAAGDAVYLKGSGTITTTNTQGSNTATFLNYASGTASNPIRILNYPGSNVALSVTGTSNAIVLSYPAQHWVLRGIRATNTDGDSSVFFFNGPRNIRLYNNYIYDSAGGNLENHSAIYISQFTDIDDVYYDVRNNWIKNYRWNRLLNEGAGPENVSGILAINKADRTEKDAIYKYNRIWDSTDDADAAGWCLKKKHGNDLGVNDAGGIQFIGNYCINAINGINTESSHSLVQGNIIWNVEKEFQSQWQETDEITGVRYLNNTGYADTHFTSAYTEDWTKTGWELKDNVHISRKASYTADEGIYRLYVYGDGTARTAFLANNALDADNNCYYNEDVAGQYNFFSNSGGGGLYNFANWKTALGVDANSFEQDPELDEYLQPTSGNCLGKGWLSAGSCANNRPWGSASCGYRLWSSDIASGDRFDPW